jgi:hypothetical protein
MHFFIQQSAKNPTLDQTGQSSTKEQKLLNENESM